jgi:iron complex outermembrane receptor protein
LGASDARNARFLVGLLAVGACLGAARVASADARPDSARADSLATTGARDTVLMLPEVRVSDERPTRAARRLPTAFTAEVRPGARGGAIDLLPELMSELPGIHVQQYGGLGSFSVMSVRGSSPGQVMVFLDGTPLTSAAHSVVSLADLPLSSVDHIEVYQGSSPLGLGPAGAGGAINLVTASGERTRELHVARGSFDTWDAHGTAAGTRGAWSALVHGGYQGSQGNFPYLDDNGTSFNPGDDVTATRTNNQFDAWTGLANLAWRPQPGFGVTARGNYFEKAQGLPGLGNVPTRTAGLEFQRALGQLEATAPGRGAFVPRATLRAGHDVERTRFHDLASPPELGLGNHDTDDRLFNDHLDLETEWPALPWALALEGGAGVSREEARLHDAADGRPDPVPSRRDRRGATLGTQWRPFQGRILVHAAERWDRIDDALHATGAGGLVTSEQTTRLTRAPQLGARARVGLGVELRGNWSKAERVPDFLELFGNQGNVLGNPLLQPEHVESWDAGAAWTLPAHGSFTAALTWAHFENRSRDLILYVRNSAATVRAQNIAAARVSGEELGWRMGRGALRAMGSFTWQDPIDESDAPYYHGKQLAQRPRREGYVQATWEPGALALGADLHELADNFLDRYNRYWVGSRTLAGAWISLGPRRWPIRMTLEGKNLGDRRVEDVAGFPLPGRTVFIACESRLGTTSR